MPNQNKILLKQTLLLISISVLFFLFGFFASYDGPEPLAGYGVFSFYFFLMIIFFTPVSIFYYGLIKNKNYINLGWLNTVLKIYYWFLISIAYISILIIFLSLIFTENGLNPSGGYGIFINSVLMITFFVPIFLFYYGLLKNRNNINLKWLDTTFKSFSWLLISTLLIIFIFGIYESFYMSMFEPEQKLNIFTRLWVVIQLIDMDKIINFLYYTPTLILAGLLYWAVRINKKILI